MTKVCLQYNQNMPSFLDLIDQLDTIHFDPVASGSPSYESPTCNAIADYLNYYSLPTQSTGCQGHVIGKLTCGEYDIAVQYWLPNTGTVKGSIFIVHGYYDHVGLFQHLIRFVLELGYIAVAYDQPGHGLSTGVRGSINSFAEYSTVLNYCAEEAQALPKPWHVIGQSTGAATLLYNRVHDQRQWFSKHVLLAPLVRPARWHQGRWLFYALRYLVKSIARKKVYNSHDTGFVEFCHQDPLQPQRLMVAWVGAMKEWLELFPSLNSNPSDALLLQGDNDKTVGWQYNIPVIAEKLQTENIVYIKGARHHLVNETKELREKVFMGIAEYLLNSGQH